MKQKEKCGASKLRDAPAGGIFGRRIANIEKKVVCDGGGSGRSLLCV